MDEAIEDVRTCLYRVLGVTARKNCFIASVEFNNTVSCNLIGSDRFLLVHTNPWQVLPDVFFPPTHRAHAHSGKYAHRKNTAGLRDYVEWL